MHKSLHGDRDNQDDTDCDARKRRRMNEEVCQESASIATNYVKNGCLEKATDKPSAQDLENCRRLESKKNSCISAGDGNGDISRLENENNEKTSDVELSSVENEAIENLEGKTELPELNVTETVSLSNAESSLATSSRVFILNENLKENGVFPSSPSLETARDLETTRSSNDDNWTTDNEAQNEEANKDESEEEDETEPISDQASIPDKFTFVNLLRDRQYGFGSGSRYGKNRKRGSAARTARHSSNFERCLLGSVRLAQRLSLSKKLDLHDGCVNCLNFNSDGSRLASGSDDLRICVWDWARGRPLVVFRSGHRGNVFQAKFMPLSGDCHIVSCSRDGQVRLADLSTCNVSRGTRLLAQHKGAAHKLALLSDSPHVFLTCGEDAAVFEIDLREQKPNKLLVVRNPENKNKPVPLYSIHTNPTNSNYFALSGRDKFCRIYDKRYLSTPTSSSVTAEPVQKFSPDHLVNSDNREGVLYYGANVTCLTYNHNGTELLASYNDDDIYLFDTKHTSERGDAVLHRYSGHRNNATIKGVNFYGPNSEFVISGSDCGYVYLWDRETEQIVNFLHADDNGVVNVLESHPTYALLATSGLDNEVKLWEPLREEPALDRKLLRKCMKSNAKHRESDRRGQGNVFDAHMLSLMIARMRRAVRTRRRENVDDDDGARGDGAAAAADTTGSGTDDADDSDSDDVGTDDDDDDEDGGAPLITCRAS